MRSRAAHEKSLDLRLIPQLAFFCSGASSLLFQALWTRMLHHAFGATSLAMSTVLSAFMGGLGLGAYLFGRRAARLRSPLVAYALCELGVAACALAIPPLVQSDGPLALVNALMRRELGAGSVAFMLARFACVLPLLLVPTTLMGGTLPLLAQHFAVGDARTASARVGRLYALNTAGAVAGTVLSSFVLMPMLGLAATNLVAIGINVALAAAILALAWRSPARVDARPAERVSPVAHGSPRRLALVAFAVSGACAMAYEVVWSRALALALGSSLQAFALILVTFLIGIAGGSALMAHLLASPRDRGLSVLALAASLLTLLALVPALALSSASLALFASLALAGALAVYVGLTRARARALRALSLEEGDPTASEAADRLLERAGLGCLLVPCMVALCELLRFTALPARGAVDAVGRHGHLPAISTAAVLASALCLALCSGFRRAPRTLAGAVQLAIASATLASYAVQDEIPYTFARLVGSVDDLADHVALVRFFMLLAAGLCTLPAAIGMGAMFPVTLALVHREGAEGGLGGDVGRVYAANTLGSIIGSFLPGFVLLPSWGMEHTLLGAMLLNLALSEVLLGAGARAGEANRALRVSCALVALVVVVQQVAPLAALRWDLTHMTLGAFRVSLARDVLSPRTWGRPELLYYRDGVSTTVSVERWGRHLALKNNGKIDASNGDDMPTQIMVGAYPLLLHPNGPRGLDVAVIGFGSGVTVGSTLAFPVRHVDAIELEDAVVDAASRYFGGVSRLPRTQARFPYVSAPRLTLHADDGRNFLAASEARYDVIVSEPSNPWITGVSDLFTAEHFRIGKARLKPGGVYCQWVQLYELSPENIKTVYRTFASAFRHVLAFSAEELSSDTILIGSDAPLPRDLRHVARAFADAESARELERAYVHTPHDLWSRLLFASREEVLAFSQTERRIDARGIPREVLRATGRAPCAAPGCSRTPAPLNTDDNMRIELRAPSDLIGFARYDGYLSVFYGEDWPYGALPDVLEGVDDDRTRLDLTLSLLAHGRKPAARAYLARVTAPRSRAERIDQRTAALLLGDAPEPAVQLAPPTPLVPLAPALRALFVRQNEAAEQAFARRDWDGCLAALAALPPSLRMLSGPDLRFRHALALFRGGADDPARLRDAVGELETLIQRDALYADVHPELYYFLARALDALRSFDKAVRNMRVYAATEVAP